MAVTYFITGASRGLGLELARQLLAQDQKNRVIAAARNPASASLLQDLIKLPENKGRIETVALDVADTKSIEAGVAETGKLDLAKEGIDVLINNAGIASGWFKSATEGTLEELKADLQVNVFGVISVTTAMLPLLRQGQKKTVWTVSSSMGSIGGMSGKIPGAAMYSATKSAVNMYIRKLSRELDSEKFTFLLLCPGYCKTDMNKGGGDLEPEVSIKKSIAVLQSKTQEDNGTFWNYEGKEQSW
ncbi:NAD-P-binding protein [Meredithblackwellia eburnea MCA 4105]